MSQPVTTPPVPAPRPRPSVLIERMLMAKGWTCRDDVWTREPVKDTERAA